MLLLLLIATGAAAFLFPAAPIMEQPKTSPVPIGNPENPVELGDVHWLRDLPAAVTAAQQSNKPILILFQEVPGCSNCTRFGSSVLTHPLIVETIESLFVPLCIYNNKGGKDAEALQLFNEAAWNNPVVRIVGPDYADLVQRMPDFRSIGDLITGMRNALNLKGLAVPPYLELLEEEFRAREAGLETATFSMYCFWSGEGALGEIPGVIETAAGFQDGKEVVKVSFNPAVLKKSDLEERIQPKGIQSCSKNEGFRMDKEPKYYLAQTLYQYIPMTSLQACRANSLVGHQQSPDALLSPRQLAILKKIQSQPDKKWKNMIGRSDLAKAWKEME